MLGRLVDCLVCWEVLIVRIRNGKIVQCNGRDNIPVEFMEYPLSCLKLLPQTTYGYGMHFWCGWIQQ
jgi:hypothetical protein